jgi:hypothetical protein
VGSTRRHPRRTKRAFFLPLASTWQFEMKLGSSFFFHPATGTDSEGPAPGFKTGCWLPVMVGRLRRRLRVRPRAGRRPRRPSPSSFKSLSSFQVDPLCHGPPTAHRDCRRTSPDIRRASDEVPKSVRGFRPSQYMPGNFILKTI